MFSLGLRQRRWGRRLFSLGLSGVFLFLSLISVQAADCDNFQCAGIENDDERLKCVEEKVACLQQKLEENKNQQTTLNGELAYIDNRIAYQEAQIEKTRIEIVRVTKEKEIRAERIEASKKAQELLAKQLADLAVVEYKAQHVSDLEIFLASNNFTTAIVKKQNGNTVNIKTSVDLMKLKNDELENLEKIEAGEIEQQELEKKNEQLKQQQLNLERQKEEKAILLAQTKNSEKEFQRLIEEARKEADAFKRFAASAGGSSCLDSSPGEGNNGWFFSQRDPRWCKQYIGGSSMTIGEVGCYITAVVMVHKKYGNNMTPSSFASNRNYFFSNTALMTTPPAPSGFSYKRQDYFNQEVIDRELREDRPVIVHVRTNNGYGGHFVVLISGENGNYKMHDPWYGPDLDFNSRYSLGVIDSLRLFTK